MVEHGLTVVQPLKVFQRLIGKRVVVKLKNGKALRGSLVMCDNCMNLVLDEAEEFDLRAGQTIVKHGRVFIRGNQVLFISFKDVAI